jgi:hypothetical protein
MPSIHDIIWQSVNHQDSFYFGWEDLLTGNDNDFDDIFTRVSGIQCAGGGDACETELEGVCRDGTMQCQHGSLTCVPNLQPTDETCNALDDDCDGMTDDGDLCDPDYICDRGKCVPKCSTGEFRCNGDLVCSQAGACVDPLCADKECPEGQVCEAGQCIDGCMDVVCPYGQVCRIGVCVDPCANVECDDGYSCHLGVCVDCDCGGCEAGESCSSDVCVPDACVGVDCAAGTHCEAGSCVDDCQGAVCPTGSACVAGVCMDDGSGGVVDGTGGTSNGTGGGVVINTGGTSSSSGGSASGEEDPAPLTEDEAIKRRQLDKAGCACNTVGGGGAFYSWLAALCVAGFAGLRRRNRR